MSLVSRLTVFVIAILAIVLAGFSLTLFVVQRWALHRQAEERMATARKALVASIEVEPDGVEWNRQEHQLDGLGSDLRWQVLDDGGRIIDATDGFPRLRSVDRTASVVQSSDRASPEVWWLARERVAVPAGAPLPEKPQATDGPDPDEIPEYPALTIVVALPTSGMQAELQRLAVLLVLLSAGILATTAAFSRSLARRALRPISEMAAAAGGITAGSAARLPVPASRDEVADLGDSFNRLIERLGAALDRERRFTAEASHQLRTPVTAMLGQIDVALRRERTAEEYRETLRSTRDQVDRLRRIVESLLALARSESTIDSQPTEEIPLEIWLPQSIQRWAGRTGERELRLELIRPATITANSELLGQLLDILIENAIKYAPAGTPVTVRLLAVQGQAAIDVLDAGTGVSEAEASAIFRPFHRGSDAIRRGIPGMGLGLALAARIADHLAAELTFDRPDEGGCQFRLRFRQSTLRDQVEVGMDPDGMTPMRIASGVPLSANASAIPSSGSHRETRSANGKRP